MTSVVHGTATAVVEPRTQEWLDKFADAGGPPLCDLSPREAREVLRAAQTSVPVALMPADIEDRTIPGGPTGEVSIRIVKPENITGTPPVVLHAHGGGWILGDKDTHDRLVRELANAARAVVVFVDYTPAPEAHYPVQNEQAYTALDWVVANAGRIGVDPARVGLFGDSVGGNMVAALTLMAKRRGGPRIAAQVLFYPVTDADFGTESYRQYADGPWLTRAAMRWFWDAYLPDENERRQPTATPLEAPLVELRGLPPALVVTDDDVLRDEGEAYASKLSQAGVPVTRVRYGGTIHDFALLNPITDTPAPRAAIAQAGRYLREHLGVDGAYEM